MGTEENLDAYLSRPMAPPAPAVLAAIDGGPVDPTEALSLDSMDRLLDPSPLSVETGWCWTPDHVAYTAVRTSMPGTSAEMWDWWFDWHPRDPLRYRIWHPKAHFGTCFEPASARLAKPFWGTVHYPEEDVGTGRQTIRLAFKPPSECGFSTDALDHPDVATIVCAHSGSPDGQAQFGLFAHVFLHADNGLVLRSHFWNGAAVPADLRGALAAQLPQLPHALAHHCAEEYSNLAALLPELYAAHGPIGRGA